MFVAVVVILLLLLLLFGVFETVYLCRPGTLCVSQADLELPALDSIS